MIKRINILILLFMMFAFILVSCSSGTARNPTQHAYDKSEKAAKEKSLSKSPAPAEDESYTDYAYKGKDGAMASESAPVGSTADDTDDGVEQTEEKELERRQGRIIDEEVESFELDETPKGLGYMDTGAIEFEEAMPTAPAPAEDMADEKKDLSNARIRGSMKEEFPDESESPSGFEGGGGAGGGGGAPREKMADSLSDDTDMNKIQKFRIRSWFPDVLFYHPNLVTDDRGNAAVAFQSGDSITEYSMDVKAATPDGEWGEGKNSFKVFQPFFLEFDTPSRLHKDDLANLSAVIFNYIDKNISAQVSVSVSDNLRLESEKRISASVTANQAMEIPVSIRATDTGKATITISVLSETIMDSIRKEIEILPAIPEHRINQGGLLQSGENVITVNIPDGAEILDDDIRLRIFSDPTVGAIELVRELNEKPHATLETSCAMVMASSAAWFQLQRNALMTEKLKEELNRYIDESWIRVLAFRNPDGFSMFPGGEADTKANLLVLDTLGKLQSVRYIDTDLKEYLISDAKMAILSTDDRELKLYAAALIAEGGIIDRVTRRNLEDVLNDPLIKNSVDPVIVGLSSRLEAGLIEIENPESYLLRISDSLSSNVQNIMVQTAGLPSAASDPIFGLSNLIITISRTGKTFDSSLTAPVMDVIYDAAWNKDLPPVDRIYAIIATESMIKKNTSLTGIESIRVNGERIDFGINTLMHEISVPVREGVNTIEITTGLANHIYQLRGRYFNEVDNENSKLVNYYFRKNADRDQVIYAITGFGSSDRFSDFVVHLPLIPGLEPVDSPSAIARKMEADYAEIKSNEILIYYSKDSMGTYRKVSLPMTSSIDGEFYLPPPTIDRYEPNVDIIAGNGTRLKWL